MRPYTFAVAALVGALGIGAGYWWGRSSAPVTQDVSHVGATPQAAAVPAPQSEKKILYYRNPMGLPDTSPAPKKDPMGMDYIPVYEGETPAAASAGPTPSRRSSRATSKSST
jgi:hypothetical protein